MKSFNLATDKWVKVYTTDEKTEELSLIEVFDRAQNIYALAGENKPQDLAVFRFIEAILQTSVPHAYKKDIDGSAFKKAKQYLIDNKDKFAFNRLYQVTRKEFDDLVGDNVVEKENGIVELKMLNRNINESKRNVNIFSQQAGKNEMSIAELVRWIICYESYSGTTDKLKVKRDEKFQASSGWLYKTDPIMIDMADLARELKVAYVHDDMEQTPIWEYDMTKYCESCDDVPLNTSLMYTMPSRVFHIEWNDGKPTVFTACLPKRDEYYSDPMTIKTRSKEGELYAKTWNIDQRDRPDYPETFQWGRILDCLTQDSMPDTFKDLDKSLETEDPYCTLVSYNYLSDGKPMSQMISGETSARATIRWNNLADKVNKRTTSYAISYLRELIDYCQTTVRSLSYILYTNKQSQNSFTNKHVSRIVDSLGSSTTEILLTKDYGDRDKELMENLAYRSTDIASDAISELAHEYWKQLVARQTSQGMNVFKITRAFDNASRKLANQAIENF